ncbi:MAG: class I SAM-dependent methyltransferase [bacterium]|nr:class I SAM-dependent methyltransferase [bacterium]
MNFTLTPRILNILSHINGPTAADIGTDHAYVPIELIKRGICTKVIASDVRQGPVDIAKDNIRKHETSDKIEVRTGSGLSVLAPGEVDDIIIAGMGGELICDIIKSDYETAVKSRLILQPMNSQYELRHYLIENGFKIVSEDISVEGFKVYNLIIAESGKGAPFECDGYYHLPPYLKEHENYKALYDKKMREFNKVIDGIKHSAKPDLNKLALYIDWREDINNFTKNPTSDGMT